MSGGVRPARPEDRVRLVELWLALLAHHAELDPHYRVRPGSEAGWGRLVDELLAGRDTAVFVHEERGALHGFCSAQVEPAPPLLVERGRAEITDLMVEPGSRRRGVGRALARAAADWIRGRGVASTIVRVSAHNPEAQAFWRALGFADHVDVLQRRG